MGTQDKPVSSYTVMDDFELVRLSQSGNQVAYAEIYRRYSVYIYNLALKLLGNPDRAQDALQDIFVKLFQNINSFQYQSQFKTWLYRVAVNHCRDVLRVMNRERSRIHQDNPDSEDPESTIDKLPDHHPSPDRETNERGDSSKNYERYWEASIRVPGSDILERNTRFEL